MRILRLKLLDVEFIRLKNTLANMAIVLYQSNLEFINFVPVELGFTFQLCVICRELLGLQLEFPQANNFNFLLIINRLLLLEFLNEALDDSFVCSLLVHDGVYLCSMLELEIIYELLQVLH